MALEDVIARRLILVGAGEAEGVLRWITKRARARGLTGWTKERPITGGEVCIDSLFEGGPSDVDFLVSKALAGLPGFTLASANLIPVGLTQAEGFTRLSLREAVLETVSDAHMADFSAATVGVQKGLAAALFGSARAVLRGGPEGHGGTEAAIEATTEAAIEAIVPEYLPFAIQKAIPARLRQRAGASFTNEMWSRDQLREAYAERRGSALEYELEDKDAGRRFAEALGLKTAPVLQREVTLDQIDFQPGTVVKPASGGGSKAVFVIQGGSEILDLQNNVRLPGLDALREAMRRALDLKHARQDSWLVERMVTTRHGGLPTDLKMLTFYGEVGLVQEATRMPTRLCYYDRSGQKVSTGRYADRAFDGTGLDQAYVDLAERIGGSVPAPFLRIDFYKTDDGPVFGEFTPKPGNFEQFDLSTNRSLGQRFIRARARLLADLFDGKDFATFRQLFRP